MAKAVVLLFLLDSLPGLSGVTCNPTLTDPVLQVVAQKLNLTAESMEILQNIEFSDQHKPSYKFQELSPESFNDIGIEFKSFHESNEFSGEKLYPIIGHNFIGNASNNDVLESPELVNKTVNASFPESVSFLAAIFETVGNVTAQTCGGVVVSPYWVLTAASCVNVLGHIYSNSTNETSENYYSIVIGAKNPLKDGSVHQVSKIYLHPTPKNGSNHSYAHQDLMKTWFSSLVGPENASAPSLALLRIHPGVDEGILPMMDYRTSWTGDARLYSWALEQHDSGFVTSATSLPAKRLSPAECKKAHGIPGNDAVVCLLAIERATNVTRINSGCPLVVLLNGRATLLGVALTDGTQPLLASPLFSHRDWLRRLALA